MRSPVRLPGPWALFHFDALCRAVLPDLVISYGGHTVVQEVLRRAQSGGTDGTGSATGRKHSGPLGTLPRYAQRAQPTDF